MNRTYQAIRVVIAVGLVLSLALLAACGTDPNAPAEQQEQSGGSESASAPTLKLVAPGPGETVPAGTVTVTVETTGLEFVMPSNDNVPGEGHVHFTLDDRPFIMSVEKQAELEDVEPGPHTLEAELVQNNTDSFSPPITQTIEFVAE